MLPDEQLAKVCSPFVSGSVFRGGPLDGYCCVIPDGYMVCCPVNGVEHMYESRTDTGAREFQYLGWSDARADTSSDQGESSE